MTAPISTDSFFNSGGGKTAKFPNIGDEIEGEITFIGQPEPQTKMGTDEIVTDKFGNPRLQVRIGLNTSQRDPEDPEDTGSRTLYVKGFLRGSIGDALRKAGAKNLEVGGRLRVKHTGTKPSDTPGLNPTKLYEASYTPPSAAATQQFFGGSPAAAPPAPVRPAAISEAAWSAMDDATKRNVAATMGVLNSNDAPPF